MSEGRRRKGRGQAVLAEQTWVGVGSCEDCMAYIEPRHKDPYFDDDAYSKAQLLAIFKDHKLVKEGTPNYWTGVLHLAIADGSQHEDGTDVDLVPQKSLTTLSGSLESSEPAHVLLHDGVLLSTKVGDAVTQAAKASISALRSALKHLGVESTFPIESIYTHSAITSPQNTGYVVLASKVSTMHQAAYLDFWGFVTTFGDALGCEGFWFERLASHVTNKVAASLHPTFRSSFLRGDHQLITTFLAILSSTLSAAQEAITAAQNLHSCLSFDPKKDSLTSYAARSRGACYHTGKPALLATPDGLLYRMFMRLGLLGYLVQGFLTKSSTVTVHVLAAPLTMMMRDLQASGFEMKGFIGYKFPDLCGLPNFPDCKFDRVKSLAIVSDLMLYLSLDAKVFKGFANTLNGYGAIIRSKRGSISSAFMAFSLRPCKTVWPQSTDVKPQDDGSLCPNPFPRNMPPSMLSDMEGECFALARKRGLSSPYLFHASGSTDPY